MTEVEIVITPEVKTFQPKPSQPLCVICQKRRATKSFIKQPFADKILKVCPVCFDALSKR